MSQKDRKSRQRMSQTGAMPRMNDTPNEKREPARPPSLPEFDDENGSVTGAITIRAEGEDRAKDADDTPTKSALTN